MKNTDNQKSQVTDQLAEAALKSAREAAKNSLAMAFVFFDNAKEAWEEAGKSVEEFVAEAREEADAINSGSTIIQLEEIQAQSQQIAGGLIGFLGGEVVGGTIGGVTASIVLGPAGAKVGSHIGGFVGKVTGSVLGGDAARQLNNQGKEESSTESAPFFDRLGESLQKRSGEIVGGIAGGVAGGIAGGVVLGPAGTAIGSVVGQAIGGHLGEDAVDMVNNLSQKDSSTESALPEEDPQEWLVKTTTTLLGEEGTTLVGSVVGGAVLGPPGQNIGEKIGTFVGKQMDWSLPKEIANPSVEPVKDDDKQEQYGGANSPQ
ncbi:MAG: hypothetical protein AB4426_06975 [Xenococcaceae cyanobacterium]